MFIRTTTVGFYLLAKFCRYTRYHIRDSIFLEYFQNNIARILIKKGNDRTREDLQYIS
jgi:hypothetical protein